MLKPTRLAGQQGGFTLVELTAVIAIIGITLGGLMHWKQGFLRDRAAQLTADGIVLIQEALYGYRMDPLPLDALGFETYEWPGNITELEPYLPNVSTWANGAGQAYALAPGPWGVIDPIIIETDMQTAEAAQDVARLFPLNGTATGSVVSVAVPVPGHEAARVAVLARDGRKDMLGDLDMGGNKIINIDGTGNDIEADNVILLQNLTGLVCPNGVQINGTTADCSDPPQCRICKRWHPTLTATNGQCWYGSACTHWSSDLTGLPSHDYITLIGDDTDGRDGACVSQFYLECR